MDYILRDIDIELWSKVKAKAPLERKTMSEVIFESLIQYIRPVEITATSDKKRKAKGEFEEGEGLICFGGIEIYIPFSGWMRPHIV